MEKEVGFWRKFLQPSRMFASVLSISCIFLSTGIGAAILSSPTGNLIVDIIKNLVTQYDSLQFLSLSVFKIGLIVGVELVGWISLIYVFREKCIKLLPSDNKRKFWLCAIIMSSCIFIYTVSRVMKNVLTVPILGPEGTSSAKIIVFATAILYALYMTFIHTKFNIRHWAMFIVLPINLYFIFYFTSLYGKVMPDALVGAYVDVLWGILPKIIPVVCFKNLPAFLFLILTETFALSAVVGFPYQVLNANVGKENSKRFLSYIMIIMQLVTIVSGSIFETPGVNPVSEFNAAKLQGNIEPSTELQDLALNIGNINALRITGLFCIGFASILLVASSYVLFGTGLDYDSSDKLVHKILNIGKNLICGIYDLNVGIVKFILSVLPVIGISALSYYFGGFNICCVSTTFALLSYGLSRSMHCDCGYFSGVVNIFLSFATGLTRVIFMSVCAAPMAIFGYLSNEYVVNFFSKFIDINIGNTYLIAMYVAAFLIFVFVDKSIKYLPYVANFVFKSIVNQYDHDHVQHKKSMTLGKALKLCLRNPIIASFALITVCYSLSASFMEQSWQGSNKQFADSITSYFFSGYNKSILNMAKTNIYQSIYSGYISNQGRIALVFLIILTPILSKKLSWLTFASILPIGLFILSLVFFVPLIITGGTGVFFGFEMESFAIVIGSLCLLFIKSFKISGVDFTKEYALSVRDSDEKNLIKNVEVAVGRSGKLISSGTIYLVSRFSAGLGTFTNSKSAIVFICFVVGIACCTWFVSVKTIDTDLKRIEKEHLVNENQDNLDHEVKNTDESIKS